MKIFWREKDIPALKGLTFQERTVAKKAVIGQVWRHWQVWLPFVLQLFLYIGFLMETPSFPYRFLVMVLMIVVTMRLAGLPFHHYLQHYLSKQNEALRPNHDALKRQ